MVKRFLKTLEARAGKAAGLRSCRIRPIGPTVGYLTSLAAGC